MTIASFLFELIERAERTVWTLVAFPVSTMPLRRRGRLGKTVKRLEPEAVFGDAFGEGFSVKVDRDETEEDLLHKQDDTDSEQGLGEG